MLVTSLLLCICCLTGANNVHSADVNPMIIDQPVYQVPQATMQQTWVNNQFKNGTASSGTDSDFDPWTVVWYVGSFGGLVVFFMVVSCSECCCASPRVLLASNAINSMTRPAPTASSGGGTCTPSRLVTGIRLDTPPPSYHLFAPPPYDVVTRQEKTPHNYGIFVVPVPVHRYTTVDMPPT